MISDNDKNQLCEFLAFRYFCSHATRPITLESGEKACREMRDAGAHIIV